MIYIFDKINVKYRKITGKFVAIAVIVMICLSFTITLITLNHINDVKFISEETKAIILRDKDNFTPEKLRAYILELNIKYPHIVMAQAIIETGNFTSNIYKENHNLFGMKVATVRPTTNKGIENGHAYFNNWKDCVVDYAFYQAAYLKDITSEKEYLQYLAQNYAEDTSYVTRIKQIIKNSKE